MNDQFFVMLAIWYTVFVISSTLHEAAHAFMANRLGDPTAYLGGQVSLDPIPHMRRAPLGMILIPLVSFFIYEGRWMMGWAMAPYDPHWAMRYPRRAAVMALAGPVSNLILAFMAGLALRYGLSTGYFVQPPFGAGIAHVVIGAEPGVSHGIAAALSVAFVLNLVLAIFNLIPVPPFDGSAVILALLPTNAARRVQEWMWDGNFQILGMIAAFALAPKFVGPAVVAGVEWVHGHW